MWEFLQAYGSWIIGGLLLLLMLRMHSGGMGCGAVHSDHAQRASPDNLAAQRDGEASEPDKQSAARPANRGSQCH